MTTATLATINTEISNLDNLLSLQNNRCRKLEREIADLISSISQGQNKLCELTKQKEKLESLVKLMKDNSLEHLVAAFNEVFPGQSMGVESSLNSPQYLAVESIKVDARRFQFKILGSLNKDGTVGSLSGCRSWNENLAGILSVWQDADGNIWVVNGHNRLAKAKALGVERVLCRFIDAKDAREARAIGALINIGEGQGTAIDVAKFCRDTKLTADDLKAQGVNLSTTLAREGIALSNLSPTLFSKVLDSTLPVCQGVAIGYSELSHRLQDELWQLIVDSKKRVSAETIAELTDLIKYAPNYSENSSLLGAMGFDDSKNLAFFKAELQANVKNQISKSKKLFDTVSKEVNTDTLEGAGAAKIDIDKSEQNSAKLAHVLFLFDCHKNGQTELSKLLDEGAIAVHEGEKKSKVVRDIEKEILNNPKLLEGYEVVTPLDNTSDYISVEPAATRMEETILETLKSGPAHLDTICGASGKATGDVLAALTTLEIEGKVKGDGGMRFTRV